MKFVKNLAAVLKFIYLHPLNKNHRFKAISSFLNWQIRSRLTAKKSIVPWIDDSQLITGLGEDGLTGNLYVGLMEFEEMAFLLHALRSTDIFVDVGANAGAYTVLASKVIGAKSIAFEPIKEAAGRLMDQIRINGIENNVEVKNSGVSDKNGSLFFTTDKDAMNKVSFQEHDGFTELIQVAALDSEISPDDFLFLKIDVEGFEFNVLDGARSILSSDKVIALIIELNGNGEEFGHSNEEIHEKLIYHEFIPVRYEPFTRSLEILNTYNKNSSNTIYVKNVEKIKDRCKLAPPRAIHTAHHCRL